MKTLVITGATSFLGRNTLKSLLDRGYNVYAFVRNDNSISQYSCNNLHIIIGDLDNVEQIEQAVDKADVFIHFAWTGAGYYGRADHDQQFKNVDYSMRALQTASMLGCKTFIFSGSQAEYGIINGVIDENTECRPVSEYGKAKLAFSEEAMRFCKDKNINFIHLRIFSVYGYGDRSETLIGICTKGFTSGQKVKLGPCKQKWSYLYIDDLTEIILRLIESDCNSGIYNIASDDIRTLRDYVNEIYELSDRSGESEFGNTDSNPEGSPDLEPSIEKLKNTIGDIQFTPFKDGILNIMRSMKNDNSRI